jgi:CAAX prenyl protease-like protein
MVTGALAGGFDWLYPLRVLAVGGVLWAFRRTYARWRWAWSWPAAALGAAVFALWLALEPPAPAGADAAFAARLASLPPALAAAWLLVRALGSAVTVPLAEELAFRGYLTRRLIAADFEAVPPGAFTWFSFLASSALFGALHSRWEAGALAGSLYALALYRRGSVPEAVLAHATTNALIAAYVLLTGSWSLWS